MNLKPFKLERFFAKYEFKAPYLLCSSDCESLSLGELLALEPGAEAAFHNLWLGYTESTGDPELRGLIADLYPGTRSDQVLVHSGAEEAIYNAMNVVLSPGDHVIVQWPCYQSLSDVAEAIGCEVTYWKLTDGPDWKLDVGFLEENLKANTKLLIINSPHNPTGYQIPQDDFRYISDLSNRFGFTVFSDEVYRLLEYDSADRLPSICEINENGIALGVMSKSYGLAGLRIGWTVTRNSSLYQKLAAFKDYTTICNSAPSEFLSKIALKHGDNLTQRNLSIIRENLISLNAFFERHQGLFEWQAPLAGPIAFPTLREGKVDAFCQRLIEEKGVLLLPGTLYDDASQQFRIGFGRKNMKAALFRLEEYLEQLSG